MVVTQNEVMALGARKTFENLSENERGRWLNLSDTGCDGLPQIGQGWVRQGLLAAAIVIPTNTDPAISLLVQALRDDIRPAENVRTTPASSPSIETLLSARSSHLRA